MLLLIKLLFAVVLTEAVTELITKADMFEPVRQKLFNKIEEGNIFEWINLLMGCGYCSSVWVGWFMALILFHNDVFVFSKYVDWFFIGLILHRFSNILHFIIDRINKNHKER